MRTIQVKGNGKVSQKPDIIEINMTLILENKDYAILMENSNKNLEILRTDLIHIGFRQDMIKTTNFNVESRYDSVKNSKGDYVREFRGYQCTHNLRLQFNYDTKILAQTIAQLAGSYAKTEFEIKFTIKDKNDVTNILLAEAVKDATTKAEILAKASNLTLGKIQNIIYDWEEINVYSKTQYKPMLMRASISGDSNSMQIEPEDINSSDSVSVIWEIE